MRLYMQTPGTAERPPRFYHLLLQQDLLGGWSLVRESGHQGARGKVQRDHFETRDACEQALLKYRDAQLHRGYRIMFILGDSEQEPV